MKLMIATSKSRDFIESEWEEQIGSWKIPPGWQVKFGKLKQFTAAERHNVSLNEAKFNFDRIIWMDTDQIYPPEYLEMMLAHTEPVVSALNVSRYYPFEICTYKFDGEETDPAGIVFPKFTAIQPPEAKVFECDCTGTGALMVDPKILEKSKIPMPYFKDIYDSEGCKRYTPDNFYFMWQLVKAGVKVTVDQNIIAKHVARCIVSPWNARDHRKAWEKVNSGFGYWKDGKK